jgi:hypothetical protein
VGSLFLVRRMFVAAGAVTVLMILGLWVTAGPRVQRRPSRLAHYDCAKTSQMFWQAPVLCR